MNELNQNNNLTENELSSLLKEEETSSEEKLNLYQEPKINKNNIENVKQEKIELKEAEDMNDWVTPGNSVIILVKIIDSDYYEGNVFLINNTNNYIIIKIKCNDNLFIINPLLTFIKPKNKTSINVKLFVTNKKKLFRNSFLDIIIYKSENIIHNFEDINFGKIIFDKEKNLSEKFQNLKLPIQEKDYFSMELFKFYNDERKRIFNEMNKNFDINSCNSADEIKKQNNILKTEIEKYHKLNQEMSKQLVAFYQDKVDKYIETKFGESLLEDYNDKEKKSDLENEKISVSFAFIVMLICFIIGEIISYLIPDKFA